MGTTSLKFEAIARDSQPAPWAGHTIGDDTSDRLQAVSNTTPPRSLTFDPSGHTTADGLRTLVNDARGRLSQVTAAAGAPRSFNLDPSGRITADELRTLADMPEGGCPR